MPISEADLSKRHSSPGAGPGRVFPKHVAAERVGDTGVARGSEREEAHRHQVVLATEKGKKSKTREQERQ